MADELSLRVQRLEESESRAWAAIERLSDRQNQLDSALATLVDVQIKMHESQVVLQESQAKLQESQAKLQDSQAKLQESQAKLQEEHVQLRRDMNEYARRTDERIAALVTAIGEYIRTRDSGTK